jgi:urease accessory protein UreF
VPQVTTFENLVTFLNAYKSDMLLALELPSIEKAYHHACSNQTRELISLDRELGKMRIPTDFASASQRIGRGQLRRLRPLRYERVAQRYLQAVEDTRAYGWHTLVYGLTLALYSVPVREGLLNYARQTLSGFVHAAARLLRLSEKACRDLIESYCQDIPQRLETLLNSANPSLRTV